MKFNIKLVATAAALALSSISSFAAINTSASPDLLLMAWDNTGGTVNSYIRDLGSISQLSASGVTSFAAPAASIFSTQFAGVAPANLSWNVVAVDASSSLNSLFVTGSVANQQGNYSDVQGTVPTINTILASLQNTANGYAKANNEYTGTTNQSANGDGTNSLVFVNFFEQGLYDAGNGVGSSQNFIQLKADGLGGDTVSQLYTNASLLLTTPGNAAGGYFTLTDAAGDLTWTNASVSAVPVPAAGLLFGPGLMAFFGAARRRFKG